MNAFVPRSVEALVEFWRTCDTEESRAAEIRAAKARIREVMKKPVDGTPRRDDEAAR